MKQAKSPVKQINTPRSPKGSGDFYGQAIKNPIGRERSSMMNIRHPIKTSKKPITLA